MTGLKAPMLDSANAFLEFALDQVQIDRSDRLGILRKSALDKCMAIGLPTKAQDFLYFPLSQIYQTPRKSPKKNKVGKKQIEPFILPESKESHLVLVDGKVDLSLSSLDALVGGLWVYTFDEAIRSYGPYLYNRIEQTIQNESNPFALLNIGLQSEGCFLHVPNNMQLEEPLQIISLSTSQENAIVNPEIICFMGEKSKLDIVMQSICFSKDKGAQNLYFDGYLSDLAELNIHQYQDQNTPHIHLNHMRFELKKQAKLMVVETSFDVSLQRMSKHIVLSGVESGASLNGLWSIDNTNVHHNHLVMEHVSPHCNSRQLFKGVLKGKAKSSFDGKIYVHRDAQKTDAFQLNKNLVLGDGAQSYSQPNLEIFADDVKASHGSTTAQLDETALFYLQSRGIDPVLARKFMIRSHLKEVMEYVFIDSLKKRMLDTL